MEQMYLIEIFVDKVTIFTTEEDESSANKNLIIKINFGPKVQFIVKEGQLAVNDERKDDIIESDDAGRRKWTRIIRVGKSFLFPSYPDTLLMMLSKFPLGIEVWNDDENEVEIFVGIGSMQWDTKFFHMLKDTADACKVHEPLSIKSKTTLYAECCCKQVGEITFILRLSSLGASIITEFQQLLKDPDSFVFRTNKAPSMFQCKRVEGDDPNFCMVGSLYETTTLEDPDIVDMAQKKIEVCTELQSCGMKGAQYVCDSTGQSNEPPKKKYPIDKIRMGDIAGPCGNTNCILAHKVRTYIRNLDTYKGKVAAAGLTEMKPSSRKVCGTCICKDERWHREDCADLKDPLKTRCEGCGGISKPGDTCGDRKAKLFGTGTTPKGSETRVAYVYSVSKFPGYKATFRQDYIVEDCFNTNFSSRPDTSNKVSSVQDVSRDGTCRCSCSKSGQNKVTMFSKATNNPMVYNVEINNLKACNTGTQNSGACTVATNMAYSTEVRDNKHNIQVYNCMEISDEKDCRCNPIKPSPPCRTFDCDCMTETANIASRKTHRPYCPSYKHKNNCPVTMMHEEEEQKKPEDEEDEVTPLPYGLPPIQLGPCPIMGRPCSVPDGFARMYRNAQLPTIPASYSDAGKVCCSKEFNRIKKAIRDYMKYEKGHDHRCINKFNVDTERRCCDKEQILMSLMGKGCCGSHKMAIQEKYKEEKQP